MSYKERSIWVSLALLIYIWFNYFSNVFGLYSSQALTVESIIDLLREVVVYTIALGIILEVIIAIINYKDAYDDDDERDTLINVHGYKYAYNLLITGAFFAVFCSIVPNFTQQALNNMLPNEYITMHIIIVSVLIAEITRLITKIIYYRKGF